MGTPTLNGTYAACVKRIGPAAAKKCIYQLYNRNKNLDFLTKIPSDSEGNPEKAMRAAAALYDEVDFLETRNYFVDSETNFFREGNASGCCSVRRGRLSGDQELLC